MTALVDIGNSNIVLSIADGEDFVHTWRIGSDTRRTGDEYYVIFRSLLDGAGVELSSVDRAALSSVVPNLTLSIGKVLQRLFSLVPMIIDHDVKSGLVRSSIPSELGSDLLCDLAQAHHAWPDGAAMTIDFGTALTFSTVDREGRVRGVAIVPGLLTAVNSLTGATAQLPQVELKVPGSVLGRDSVSSIRAGVMYGYAGLVESIIARTEEELGEAVHCIATGGLCKTISPLIPRIDEIDRMHTLRGLKLLSDLNR